MWQTCGKITYLLNFCLEDKLSNKHHLIQKALMKIQIFCRKWIGIKLIVWFLSDTMQQAIHEKD